MYRMPACLPEHCSAGEMFRTGHCQAARPKIDAKHALVLHIVTFASCLQSASLEPHPFPTCGVCLDDSANRDICCEMKARGQIWMSISSPPPPSLDGRSEAQECLSPALHSSFKRKVTALRVRWREMTIFNQAAGVQGGGDHTSVRGLVKVAAGKPREARNWSVQITLPYPALPNLPCWQNRHKCEKPTRELNMTPVRLSSGIWQW